MSTEEGKSPSGFRSPKEDAIIVLRPAGHMMEYLTFVSRRLGQSADPRLMHPKRRFDSLRRRIWLLGNEYLAAVTRAEVPVAWHEALDLILLSFRASFFEDTSGAERLELVDRYDDLLANIIVELQKVGQHHPFQTPQERRCQVAHELSLITDRWHEQPTNIQPPGANGGPQQLHSHKAQKNIPSRRSASSSTMCQYRTSPSTDSCGNVTGRVPLESPRMHQFACISSSNARSEKSLSNIQLSWGKRFEYR